MKKELWTNGGCIFKSVGRKKGPKGEDEFERIMYRIEFGGAET